MVGGLELLQLRKLQPLARCLFLELVSLADFVTGNGRTSWAVLAALLDWDVAPQANTAPGATPKRLRHAMAELEALGLVALDRIANEKRQALLFQVKPRAGLSASDDMRGRVQGRASKPGKPATTRVSRRPKADAGQSAGQRVQEPGTIPLPPTLSTGTKPPPAIGELLQRMSPRRGKTGAPEGA